MKKALMLITTIIIIISGSLPAQIVIPTNTYTPPVGTELRTGSIDIIESFYNTVTSGTGGGHLWDFSPLLFPKADTFTVVDVSTTPGVATFTTANLCVLGTSSGDSIWTYSESLPGSLQALGNFIRAQSVGDIITVYENTAPDYVFPIAFGNTWTAHKHWNQIIAPGSEIQNSDTTFYEVDAYGEMKYGNNTVLCLRLKATERLWSITYVSGVPISTNVVNTERYDYITADYHDGMSVSRTTVGSIISYGAAANLDFIDQQTLITNFDGSVLPDEFSVSQNYPNPFNPATSFSYDLPRSSDVTMEIINISGQIVKVFDFGTQSAGNHKVTIDISSDISPQLSSGVYFYRISAGNVTQTRKMMFLK